MTIKSQKCPGAILRENHREIGERGAPYSRLQVKIKLVATENLLPSQYYPYCMSALHGHM